MREDMFKVIVERPRLLNSNPYSRDGRKFRNDEDTPAIIGIKRGYSLRKHPNENLAPLIRYLQSQCNRPWNKVYAEIRAQIDSRNTVQQHIMQHLYDFVAINTHWQDTPQGGQVLVCGTRWRGQMLPLGETRYEMYVDPRSGILLKNRYYGLDQKNRAQQRQQAKQQKMDEQRLLDAHTLLKKLDGNWYRIKLSELPAARLETRQEDGHAVQYRVVDRCWDVLCKAWVGSDQPPPLKLRADGKLLYASHKQQLSAREIKEYQLK